MLTGELIPPDEVCLARDLPASFLLGDLAPDSFHRDAHGWQAQYVDRAAPGTWVRVRYVAGGPFLAFPRWRGLPGMSAIDPGNSWVDLARRFCENGIPEAWERTACARIEAVWSLGFRTGAPRLPAPENPLEGPEYLIIFPERHSDYCREARFLLAGSERHCDAGGPVSAESLWVYRREKEVREAPEVMDPVERRPLVPPFWLHAWPGAEMPALPPFDPDPPKGSIRWLPRLQEHRLISVRCPFRDIERVLDLLDGVALLPEAVGRIVRPGRERASDSRRISIPSRRLRGFIMPAAEFGGEHEFVHINGKESMRVRYSTKAPDWHR